MSLVMAECSPSQREQDVVVKCEAFIIFRVNDDERLFIYSFIQIIQVRGDDGIDQRQKGTGKRARPQHATYLTSGCSRTCQGESERLVVLKRTKKKKEKSSQGENELEITKNNRGGNNYYYGVLIFI